jgi:hypothetical protein
LLKERVLKRSTPLVDKEMWLDILGAYQKSNKYFKADYVLDGSKDSETVFKKALEIVKSNT